MNVAVLLGGKAAEREISLESGANVAECLEQAGALVSRVDPAVDGWQAQLKDVAFVSTFFTDRGRGRHVQGFLELMGLAYSGCGVLASALTMDKVRTKLLWQGAMLKTPPFNVLTIDSDWQAVIDELGSVFVKPALEGSSLGMSRADSALQLRAAHDQASRFGSTVMAEQFVSGPEYTVAILGDRALPSIRIDVPGEFYDFDAKYRSDKTLFSCPSDLSSAEELALADLALTAFRITGGEVWGRVDVMRDAAGDWQLLEVNTVPGMTSHSLVPMAAKAVGLLLNY